MLRPTYFDLAEIYGYETSKLNQQVKRNADKFSDDFMFQITKNELKTIMMSQNVISRWGETRKLPYALCGNLKFIRLSYINLVKFKTEPRIGKRDKKICITLLSLIIFI